MSNYIIKKLYDQKKHLGDHTASYKLYRAVTPFGKIFIFYVKYKCRIGNCILNCRTANEAQKLFSKLVRTCTTPLSLNDTLYELSKEENAG